MKTWGVWGVVAIIMLAGCGGAATPTATPPPTNTAVPTATFTSTTLPTSTPTAIVASTPSPQPTATPTPVVPGSSQSNPVPFGDPVRYTVPNIGNLLELRLTRVIRGSEAQTIVNRDKSTMPATLDAGEEFYAVYAEVTHVDQHGGLEALPIASPVGWSAIADGQLIDAATIVMMQDQLLSSGLRPGKTLAGWIPFRIPIGAEVSQLHFSLNDTMPGLWFALKD